MEIVGTIPGEIASPNFPANYPANKDCTWKIKAPLGNLVRVTITNLNLKDGDTLTLSDGETAFPGNTIGKLVKIFFVIIFLTTNLFSVMSPLTPFVMQPGLRIKGSVTRSFDNLIFLSVICLQMIKK